MVLDGGRPLNWPAPIGEVPASFLSVRFAGRPLTVLDKRGTKNLVAAFDSVLISEESSIPGFESVRVFSGQPALNIDQFRRSVWAHTRTGFARWPHCGYFPGHYGQLA